MWIVCQICYDVRLWEQERKEANKRNNSELEGAKNHIKDHPGDLEVMELLIAAQGMRLIFVVWNRQKLQLSHKATH